MSDQSKYKLLSDMSYSDTSKARVYINPNFNKQIKARNTWDLHNNTAMHINPKFSHLLANAPPNNTKIYVNPNFIKPTNKIPSNTSCTFSNKEPYVPQIITAANNESDHSVTIQYQEIVMQTPPQTLVTKSKYCLVRKNETKKMISASMSCGNTFKINKYKSVQRKDFEQNFGLLHSRTIPVARCGYSGKKFLKSQNLDSHILKSGTQSKFVKDNRVVPVANNTIRTKYIVPVKMGDRSKRTLKLNQSVNRIKKIKRGNLKKNNIPCPLFRKYGKCLRDSTGSCDFLHDKKHVSICRKFIKGICHDTECCLSHDLTQRKMPTCYFYLQGKCVKEGCPYLHVKLNENAKICPDFLKGYCEKGSKCLNRHVNAQSKNMKVIPKSKKYTGKLREDIARGKVLHKNSEVKQITTIEDDSKESAAARSGIEHRYYEENTKHEDTSTNDVEYEVIKPTRCKLGTLPSYIQL